MLLPDAQRLTLSLMHDHGLRGWVFAFNRRKRCLGLCRHHEKQIELSIFYISANDEESVRDTILHEIAHALAGPAAGHGPKWKAKCVQIGAKPERLDRVAAMPVGRWKAVCPACRKQYTRHRKPMRNRRYICRACGPDRGVLSFVI